jgi:hypothetical protein
MRTGAIAHADLLAISSECSAFAAALCLRSLSSGLWLSAVAACRGGGRDVEELALLALGEFLVAGVVYGLGQELPGLGDQAGKGVQPDG